MAGGGGWRCNTQCHTVVAREGLRRGPHNGIIRLHDCHQVDGPLAHPAGVHSEAQALGLRHLQAALHPIAVEALLPVTPMAWLSQGCEVLAPGRRRGRWGGARRRRWGGLRHDIVVQPIAHLSNDLLGQPTQAWPGNAQVNQQHVQLHELLVQQEVDRHLARLQQDAELAIAPDRFL